MLNAKFESSRPYRHVRYARMSSEMQNERSPEQQFNEIDRRLRCAGHPWVHVCDYRHDTVSGRLMRKRPGFQEMLEDVRSGRIQVDLILVDALERFGRMQELPALRNELQTRDGVLLLTADSGFTDPTSVAGTALGMVESIRATTHGHALAHNVRRGKRDAAKLKHWPGGPAPRGYRLQSVLKSDTQPAEVDYRVLVPDPATALVVQRIFQLAHEHGWGGFRIAKHLNADPAWEGNHGKISGSAVNFMLDNPIYVGTLRYNRFTTGVADDRRVSRRNEESDVVYIEGFCEPVIDREAFDAVQAVRRQRSERISSARSSRRNSDSKQLKPIAPGVTVKYPLTGLVRCAVCGGSMRPNSSRYRNTQYMYYYCPNTSDARCSNRRRIRGDWLWGVFCTHLRETLFPLPTEPTAEAPSWLVELIAEIRVELVRGAEQRQSQRPLVERELADLSEDIAGWTQSLANPKLASAVRVRVENEFGAALARKQDLEAQLAGLAQEVKRADALLTVDPVIVRLNHLSDLLDRSNPTALNIELTRHVEQILVHPDGRVVLRTHRLGVFEGVTRLLALPADLTAVDECESAAGVSGNGNVKPRSALLARRETGQSLTSDRGRAPQPDLGLVKLPDKWAIEHMVCVPERFTFSHLRAREVLAKKLETGWSNAKLARHFGVSAPTIRSALHRAGQNVAINDANC